MQRPPLAVLFVPLLAVVVTLSGCDSRQRADAAAPSVAAMPSGAQGDLIRYGKSIIDDTQRTAKPYVVANMNCSACHVASGTKPKAGSFLGIYALFPQYNQRAHRFIALQDRIAECFLNSMNGHPPAYWSREMTAVVAYIAWLSRGSPVGIGVPDQGYPKLAARSPDVKAGEKLYAAKCATCHGTNGGGFPPSLPPLWGKASFNDGAGMSHVEQMSSFIRYNMPASSPGSLTDQQAWDIAAWVLSHPRPTFDRAKPVEFAPKPASFF